MATTYLQRSVLCLNGNDLVPYQLQNSVYNRLETLQNLLVGKGHITFFDARLWKLSFNTDVHRPFLAVVTEIGFYSVFKVHDALRVHFAGCFRAVGQLHLADLGS